MKMSKAERKAYNEGRQSGYTEGYTEGYSKGFHDGNPFNAVAEAIADVMRKIGDMTTSPEFLEAIGYALSIISNSIDISSCVMNSHAPFSIV